MEGLRNFIKVDSHCALERRKWNPRNRAQMWIILRRTGGDRPWLTLIGMLFCRTTYKGIEGSEWREGGVVRSLQRHE